MTTTPPRARLAALAKYFNVEIRGPRPYCRRTHLRLAGVSFAVSASHNDLVAFPDGSAKVLRPDAGQSDVAWVVAVTGARHAL